MAKILVVEDDELLREMYTDTLTAEGHQVEIAEDGELGYEKIKKGGWDLILLDIIMPKMSGLDLMQKLQGTQVETPNKCIIFLTNLDKGEEISRALKLGNGYLIKSQITPGDLVQRVNSYLSLPPGQTVAPAPVSGAPQATPVVSVPSNPAPVENQPTEPGSNQNSNQS